MTSAKALCRRLISMGALLCVLIVAGCAGNPAPSQTAAEEPGSSFATAIVLEDAHTEFDGVAAEHRWVKKNMPGWRWGTQSLINHDGRVYDLIELSKDGVTRNLYFDITDWFGKLE
ncbi:MAG TPA: hypothetical protein PLR41_17430 [Alphaproteobacteria bacterium]|nr:hypothetical protein [Alphaproteobacteria bacterium]